MPDLHKKVGPFPLFVWLGIGTVAVLGAYFYLHGSSSSGTTAGSTVGTDGVQPATALDPTTGLPYAGGAAGSGSTGVDAGTAGSPPSIGQEIADVQSLGAALQALGLFQAPPAAVYDDSGVRSDIQALQQSLQAGADHSSPPAPADRAAPSVIRPSAAHGGALYEYKRLANGQLQPVGRAKAGAKATAAKPTQSGAKTGTTKAPAVKTVKINGKVHAVGSTVTRPSAAHGGAHYVYKVQKNGTLKPLHKA